MPWFRPIVVKIVFMGWVVLLSACSYRDLQNTSQGPLEGNWKLSQIRCDGQESTIWSDSALSSGISTAQISGTTGRRHWTIGACQLDFPMTSVSYLANNILQATDSPTQCSGDCSGLPSGFCSANLPANVPWSYTTPSNNLMTITMPAVAKAGGAPCGAGQTTANVVLLYERM